MSKYTTEVRFICESYAGLQESADGLKVNDILEKSWDKVVTTPAKFFIESHKKEFTIKLLKHFYTREIGAETVGLWKLWLNERIEELLPYYNQLYESATLEVKPLVTKEEKRILNDGTKRSEKETNKRSEENAKNEKKEVSGKTSDKERYSDTPQGGLAGIEAGTYLTNATLNDETSEGKESTSGTEKRTASEENGRELNEVKNVTEDITAKEGLQAELLVKYRESFVNIDKMFINEFEDLFMGLW